MKNLLKIKGLMLFALLAVAVSCSETDLAPQIQGISIDNNDLIQVSNTQPTIPVRISASGSSIQSITVNITPVGSTTSVASNSLRNITATDLGSITVNVPFPLPATAPSGQYTISYNLVSDGNTKSTSYIVNVLNYRTVTLSPCTFPNSPLPSGKNVWFQVTAPANTDGEDIWVTGNFEQAAGGSGDWTGGGTAALKMTKVSGSNYCYFIALNLTASSEFKLTRGNWDKRVKDINGNDIDNIKWNSQSLQNYTVGNWSDRVVLPPVTLPLEAIQTGKITVVTDVGSNSDVNKYFLVKKGVTTLDGAISMNRVVGTNKMAAAVAKEVGAQYIVVKDIISKTGLSTFGTERVIVIDGLSNPNNSIITGFKTEFSNFAPIPTNLFIVGDATPGGWNNPVPTPAQQFTNSGNGVFTLTLALLPKEYLLLPTNGSWDTKFGMGGSNSLSGDLVYGGNNFKAPSVAGTYKFTIDTNSGTYTLIKQ